MSSFIFLDLKFLKDLIYASMENVVTVKYAARALGLTEAALYLAIKENRVESRIVLDRITIPRPELARLKRQKAKRVKQPNGNGRK